MHLHIDCSFGIAGDMLLAALADAGADVAAVGKALRELALDDFELESAKVLRGGIGALHIDVKDLTKKSRSVPDDGAGGRHQHDHGHHHHHHEHSHDHPHEHGHEPDGGAHEHHSPHSHDHGEGGPHRHLSDLLALLDPDVLSERVRQRAEKVFRILAEAEAAVHSLPVERVHFHEVSGIDTAVDVIGCCIALEMLNIDSISAAPPAAGSGMIMCEHGVFAVPAPATLEILKSRNVPWLNEGEGERMTPTGAALLAGLADSFGTAPQLTVTRIGYGAGTRDFADVPNLLRVIIGKPLPQEKTRSDTIVIPIEETQKELAMPLAKDILFPPAPSGDGRADYGKAVPEHIVEFRLIVDDMTPEMVAYLQEVCLANGAVEAYSLPATMKKGRLGHEITVLAPSDKAAEVLEILWRNSSTFGIRIRETSRLTLHREIKTIHVKGHPVRVKIGWFGDEIVRRQPEYEDCRAVAVATGLPLAEVYFLARNSALDL